MYRSHRVAVVIPAHQEAALIATTVEGLPGFVDHVIVVDDASADDTAEIAAATGRAGLEICQHAVNRGVGAAISTGYRRALERGAELVVVVGGDAQMDPAEMSLLLDPLVEGEADYAKGDRLGHPLLWRRMPWRRIVGSWALTWMTRWASGHWHVRDSQCGYTAIRAATLRALPLDALYPRYGYPNDLLIRLGELQARVVDRPITPIYGAERSGLRIPKVIGPLLRILIGGGLRRHARRLPLTRARLREDH